MFSLSKNPFSARMTSSSSMVQLLVVATVSICLTAAYQECGRKGNPYPNEKKGDNNQQHQFDEIVGGEIAGKHEFPWQVYIKTPQTPPHGYNGERYFETCGGSVLNDRWVLTAAHCINPWVEELGPVEVQVGLWNMDHPTPVIHSRVAFSHPDNNPHTMRYDVALIQLPEPLDLTGEAVGPVCLPDRAEQTLDPALVGEDCLVSGWGRTEAFNASAHPVLLQKLIDPIIAHDVCVHFYRCIFNPVHQVESDMMCADRGVGHSTCFGDSGGALVCPVTRDDGTGEVRWVEVGVVSWAQECNTIAEGWPTVFARVADPDIYDWIKAKVEAHY